MKYDVLPLGYVVAKNIYKHIIFYFQYNYCNSVGDYSRLDLDYCDMLQMRLT